jgi:UDP-2,4-diacetamido-2,4,6-trideoxy-beta-L-altropyranose hydrolase
MRIVFRTDGNHAQGMGDIWGSLALAEAFGSSHDIQFVISDGPLARETIADRGYRVTLTPSLEEEIRSIAALTPEIVIVNKLNSESRHIRSLKSVAKFVVTIDDSGEAAKEADLNVNVLYPVEGSVTGPQFVTLREEFRQTHRTRPISPNVQRLLITQGGADTYGFTPPILEAVFESRFQGEVMVILGPAFRHENEFKAVVADRLPLPTVFRNANNMAALLGSADLAITAGGLTMFELCCLGTPSLVVCAELFEVATASRLEEAGAVINLGFGSGLDYRQLTSRLNAVFEDFDLRRRMSERGRALVDGRGAERVAQVILERADLVEAKS